MSDAEDFSGYFVIKQPQDGPLPSFAFGKYDYVDKVIERWKADQKSQNITEDSVDDAEFTHQSTLTDALKSSVDFGLAQHELIESAEIAPMIIKIAIMQGEIIGVVQKEAKFLKRDQSHILYGLDEKQYAKVAESYDRYSMAKKGLDRFPSAVLLSLVATFDTLVLDILTKMLKLQSDWLERSERTVSLSRIAAASNLEELISEQISEELYQFSRGSHTEQANYIKRNFGIDISKDWIRWPDYIEIFERRNLVAHGETKFNARYVRICSDAGHRGSEKLLGETIELRNNYLKQSLSILIEFAVLLSFSLFRKFVKESEGQAFVNLNEAIYKLIQRGHFTVAERLADYALSLKSAKMTTETRLMIVVNRASAIRHNGRLEDAKSVLESEDWSAVSDIFKVCVSCISDNLSEFEELLPKTKASGDLTAQSILTWPCFSFARKSEEGQRIIKKVFGIDLSEAKEADNLNPSLDGVGSSAATEIVIH